MKELTFKQAQAKLVEHLRGSVFAAREDAETTNIDMMVKLNQAGIITVDSQEGVIDGDLKERAYLQCFVPPDVGKKLIEKMNKGEFRAWEIKRLSDEDMDKYYDTSEVIPVTTYQGRPQTRAIEAYALSSSDVALYKGEDDPNDMYDFFNISEPKMMLLLMDTVYGRHGSSEGGLFTTLLKTMRGGRKTRRRKLKQTRRKK